jgi:hypothetical protein
VVAPEVLPDKFYLHIKAQGLGRAKQNAYYITNDAGGVIYEKAAIEDNEDFLKTGKTGTRNSESGAWGFENECRSGIELLICLKQ